MKDKKSRQFLTDDERWAIYKYCIENHCLFQNGDSFKFRVSQSVAADEINTRGILNRKITSYHVNSSVFDILEWERRFQKFPEPQETMEMDMLKVQHTKDINEIETLKQRVKELEKEIHATKHNAYTAAQLQDKINKAIGVLKTSA